MPPNNSFTIRDLVDALKVNLPNLTPATLYPLQDLVGDTFWFSMPTGTRKHLGVEFKDVALSGGLPVKWSCCKSNNSNFYQLK